MHRWVRILTVAALAGVTAGSAPRSRRPSQRARLDRRSDNPRRRSAGAEWMGTSGARVRRPLYVCPLAVGLRIRRPLARHEQRLEPRLPPRRTEPHDDPQGSDVHRREHGRQPDPRARRPAALQVPDCIHVGTGFLDDERRRGRADSGSTCSKGDSPSSTTSSASSGTTSRRRCGECCRKPGGSSSIDRTGFSIVSSG